MAKILNVKNLVQYGFSSQNKPTEEPDKDSIPCVHLLVDDITSLGGVQSFVRQFVGNSAEIGCEVKLLSRFQSAAVPTDINCAIEFLYPEDFSKFYERLKLVDKNGEEALFLQSELKRLQETSRSEFLRHAESWGSNDFVLPLQAGPLLELLDVGFWGQPRKFPLFFQYHGTFEYAREQAYWARLIRGLGEVDGTILLSDGDAAAFAKSGARNCTAIPNSIELYKDPRPILKREKVAVYIGRLDAEKSVDLLLKSWAKAKLGKQGWKLKIFGSGTQQKALESLSADLGVDASVSFEGRTSNPLKELSSAQLHLLASQREGMPMAILEANSSGTPTIAYNASPGIADIIKDGRNGFVAQQGNIDEWTKRLIELANSEAKREVFSKNASLLAKSFTPAVVNEQWRKLLRGSASTSKVSELQVKTEVKNHEDTKNRLDSVQFRSEASLLGDFKIAFRTNGEKIPAKELLVVVEVSPVDDNRTSRDTLELPFSKIVNGQFINMPGVAKSQGWVEIPLSVKSECSKVSVTVIRWGTKTISPATTIKNSYLVSSRVSNSSKFSNSITAMEQISRNG